MMTLSDWIPAFAGMTHLVESAKNKSYEID